MARMQMRMSGRACSQSPITARARTGASGGQQVHRPDFKRGAQWRMIFAKSVPEPE